MVGIPRSKGCLTCISRRVKCDELRPECSQCKRGGRECGGYNRPTKFVNAGSAAMKSHTKSQASGSISTPSPPSSNSGIDTNSIIQTALAKVSPHAELLSPDHELAQTLSVFITSFSPSSSYANNNAALRSFTPWLSCIPSYLGKSSALDGAVACLSLHSIGSFSQNSSLARESFRFYGKALYWLRQNLKSNYLALAPETLCATMLLSIFELFACTKESSWVQHAGGARELIKVRGAQRHMFGFDRTMFNAFRGIILLESVVSGQPCFLELPEWKEVDMFPNHIPTPVELLIQDFYNTAPRFSRLRQEVKLIRAGKRGNLSREQLITELIDLQIHLDNCTETLKAISSEPREALSTRGDQMFPFVYMFESNPTASLFCHCASFSLMTRRCIAELGVPGWDFPMVRNTLVDNICKTVEYATSKAAGVFGMFYITFNLRIAYGIAREPIRSWIEEKLSHIAKVMPAARPNPDEDRWDVIEEADFEEAIIS